MCECAEITSVFVEPEEYVIFIDLTYTVFDDGFVTAIVILPDNEDMVLKSLLSKVYVVLFDFAIDLLATCVVPILIETLPPVVFDDATTSIFVTFE